MGNGVSIGEILRNERESRSLSLEQVHDATKITTQNVGALEEDRFEAFPNKVYARAFLRDYANFLGLDSSALLARYEETWSAPVVVEPVVAPRPRRAWRKLGYALLTIVFLGGLGAAGYVYWDDLVPRERVERVAAPEPAAPSPARPGVLPVPPTVTANGAPAPGEPKPATTPVPAPVTPQPAQPEKLTLQVAALRTVWLGVWSDGKKIHDGNIAAGTAKTFEAKKKIRVRVGMADAVQLKLNGETQESLGTSKQIGDRVFALPEPSPTPAAQPIATPLMQPGPANAPGPAVPASRP